MRRKVSIPVGQPLPADLLSLIEIVVANRPQLICQLRPKPIDDGLILGRMGEVCVLLWILVHVEQFDAARTIFFILNIGPFVIA